MQVERLILGELETNCYLLTINKEVIIIDPAAQAGEIINKVGERKVRTILITHNHFDHIGALEELQKYYQVKVNDFTIKDMKVISTKGHTRDSKTFYFPKEKKMFCGDFLFANSYGRTDLATGDEKEMLNSLKLISKYPDDITLYPGHGNITNLGIEKKNFEFYYNNLF